MSRQEKQSSTLNMLGKVTGSEIQKIEEQFQCRPREWDGFQCAGAQIESKPKKFRIHRYISKLEPIPPD